MGEYLGHALANIAAVLDPAIFVIGGEFPRQEMYCFHLLKSRLKTERSLQARM